MYVKLLEKSSKLHVNLDILKSSRFYRPVFIALKIIL